MVRFSVANRKGGRHILLLEERDEACRGSQSCEAEREENHHSRASQQTREHQRFIPIGLWRHDIPPERLLNPVLGDLIREKGQVTAVRPVPMSTTVVSNIAMK
jgi:hypothetical protein